MFCIYSPVLNGQCGSSPSISLSGNACVGNVLKATTNTAASTIIWKLNGSTTVAAQTATIPANGVTVAGGNGGGANANQLLNPNRLFIDGLGNLYIPDMSNSRIQKWTPGATAGVTVAGGNGVGSAANQFDRPTSVFLDSKGNLYVTDQSNGRVQKWAPGANTGVTVVNSLSTPTAVFVDANDNLYVSEQNSSLVSKWPPGATSRIVVAGGNGYGSAPNQLSTPTGIFVDTAGNIYICDTDNDRVQKWAPGANSGTTVAGGNNFGSAPNQLANPLGIYVDVSGNIYVSDFNNYRVQKWSPGATAGITVAGGNGAGSASNQLNRPAGITMDSECNLYVSDFYNHRVQKFATTITNTYTTVQPGDYTATMITPSGYTATSNTVTVLPSNTPQVTISSDKTIICSGTAVAFNATPINGGTTPSYQWQLNGNNVGSDSPVYTNDALNNGDVVRCILTSNAACVTKTTAISDAVTITVNVPTDPLITIAASATDICISPTVTFSASVSNGGINPVYQWKKNGQPAGTNNNTYTGNFITNDVVACELTSHTGCSGTVTVSSNSIVMQSTNDVIPEVTVAASAVSICSGSNVTFTATNKSNSRNPVYQWTVNGTEVGTSNTTYTTNSLTNGAVVVCRMTVPQCGGGTTKDFSDSIIITVKPTLNPSVVISASAITVCKGSPVTFSAKAVESGSNPTYEWNVNGSDAGANGSTFTATTLSDGDEVQCVLLPDLTTACTPISSEVSNIIKMKVTEAKPTTITIAASDNDVCAGTPVRFTAIVENAGVSPSYQWDVNGVKVGTNSPVYTDGALQDGDRVTCILSAQNTGCALSVITTSHPITVSIKLPPTVVIHPADTTVASGTQLLLAAAVTADLSSFVWTPANNLSNPQSLTPVTEPLQQTTTYELRAVATNGCKATGKAVINVVTSLYIPNSFTPNGDGRNDLFRIPPSTSLKLKELAIYDRWGNKVFSTTDVGKGWDGTYKGVDLDSGVYVYFLT
ncbi:MAG: gliding motility-associated C-terminal domain-containing protein, partial [Bacteroidota bacterium]|nr:gliding motility-associated C-terminal domain-containing protein [Bacteroidota bacterium]